MNPDERETTVTTDVSRVPLLNAISREIRERNHSIARLSRQLEAWSRPPGGTAARSRPSSRSSPPTDASCATRTRSCNGSAGPATRSGACPACPDGPPAWRRPASTRPHPERRPRRGPLGGPRAALGGAGRPLPPFFPCAPAAADSTPPASLPILSRAPPGPCDALELLHHVEVVLHDHEPHLAEADAHVGEQEHAHVDGELLRAGVGRGLHEAPHRPHQHGGHEGHHDGPGEHAHGAIATLELGHRRLEHVAARLALVGLLAHEGLLDHLGEFVHRSILSRVSRSWLRAL